MHMCFVIPWIKLYTYDDRHSYVLQRTVRWWPTYNISVKNGPYVIPRSHSCLNLCSYTPWHHTMTVLPTVSDSTVRAMHECIWKYTWSIFFSKEWKLNFSKNQIPALLWGKKRGCTIQKTWVYDLAFPFIWLWSCTYHITSGSCVHTFWESSL